MKIPFNKPYLTGKETFYIQDAVYSGHLSGNGKYTKKCQTFFEEKYKFKKTLLTTSCTDALEMCAMLLDIKEGDEVIMPSYTFVSTALAFVRQGAKIVFVDSGKSQPNMDVDAIESLINNNTKAIVPVHYAGVAVEMDKIMQLADRYNLYVVEDAAQGVDSYYKNKPLGGVGHLGAFSFHETKNVIAGEGGLLIINEDKFIERAEILWEKGTNRASFFRGEINKYGWVDTGSSFLPSELTAAFLFAQLENIEEIQKKRISNWHHYYNGLISLEKEGKLKLPVVTENATNNGHMFYIVCNSENDRAQLIDFLKKKNIFAVFHYLSLHNSNYYSSIHGGRELPQSDYYSNHLLRLPMYYELEELSIDKIVKTIKEFYSSKTT
ncbi:dTDP-4-amino-4,6-dideoxygalactose transaminase [Gelidibacter algens]|uniref:dTDP-4-amino-4,6-dideoxygalactose transaminase n=1 Tax=Gelidibacter algens TaxID=49280 RepID=A0A1A7QWM5_9FLAO|nr:dTDP-4-amino-4,6-dideoxygalactose transaminase [Gelidibacter algens]OBX23956.1 dTDP-4-amino-4,6-dideoxygalactose transaminase [Gelidibacter algens]RAJ24365.1 dTDP-4-amino-4,6-dideoxygalactose transaminase [Gelidibacter algens]